MFKQNKIVYGGLRTLERELMKADWKGMKYTILLDENTFRCCLPQLISQVEPLQEAEFIEVPASEECKSLEVAAQVWQTLLESGADRQHVLVNLGGGSVCDLGGFVAAGYKRGIRHINIPTTLLSMIDAAIGGKTAVDFGGIKNSVGFFHQSVLTVIDHVFCDTLEPEQLLCGQMEMVKTAAVTDTTLYEQLISSDIITKQQIAAVARIKNRIVKEDPYDHGIRKILNFGHTFGHAIEIFSGLPHGFAVGIGMKAAMYLSTKKTGLSEDVYLSYSKWVRKHISIPKFTLKDIEQMLPLLHQDKKASNGVIHCVLLQEIGAAVVDMEVSDNEVRDALLKV